ASWLCALPRRGPCAPCPAEPRPRAGRAARWQPGSMSEPAEDTPATSSDPALPGEGDHNQLPKEDTLEDRGVDDLIEEGYSPPERDPLRGQNLTEAELIEGDTLEERLDTEQPEVWEVPQEPDPSREPDRAGRIEAVTDEAAA